MGNLIVPAQLCNISSMGSPFIPAFKGKATAPTNHNKNTLLVATLKKIIGTPWCFHSQSVQVHEFQVTQIGIYTFVRWAQHHVFNVTTATDHDVFTIYLEYLGAQRIKFVHPGADYTNTK